MKIKELINSLNKENPELDIVMSRDAEGNGFSPLAEFSKGHYEPESTFLGIVFTYGKIHECGKGKETAICLWPIN